MPNFPPEKYVPVDMLAISQPDGHLYSVVPYIEWEVGNKTVILDGEFSAEDLIFIATHMVRWEVE